MDSERLARYVHEGSEAAFAELVGQHFDLVCFSALRHVHDSHLAQDIAQLVFANLARKARSLPTHIVLAGWLHRDTHFTALALLRAERRRRERESKAGPLAMMCSDPTPNWEQLTPVLDEALDRLKREDRDAILLRFFQQRTFGEVGTALGSNEEAARKRVNRALDKLRLFLAKRGITTTAAALATVLTANAAQAAPVGLATAITPASLAAAAGPVPALAWAKGVLKLIALTKLQSATAVGLALLVVGGAATVTIALRTPSTSLRMQVQQIVEQKLMRGQWKAGMEELWSLGTNVIPHLAGLSDIHDSVLADDYARLWRQAPATVRNHLPPPLDRPRMRQAAMQAIEELGPLAVRRAAPQVIDRLAETDDRYNNYAAQGLRWLVPESRLALERLRSGLAGTNATWPVARSFLNIDDSVWPKIPEVIPLVTNFLNTAESAYHAAIVLGRLGSAATSAVPALVQAVELGAAGSFPDQESARWYQAEVDSGRGMHPARIRQDDKGLNHNRAMAALALGRIGVATPEVRDALARAWNAPDPWVRGNAAQAVGLLGPTMTNCLPELLAGLVDDNNGALGHKLLAMGKLGPPARDALGTLRGLAEVRRLQALVREPNSQVVSMSLQDLSLTAKMAICRIAPPEGRSWLPEIAALIGRWYEPVEFLAEPSPLSNDIVRAVEPLLGQPDAARQSLAAYVVVSQNRTHSGALAVLRRNRSSGEVNDRLLAGQLLFRALGETNELCAIVDEGFAAPQSHIGQGAGQIAEAMGEAALPSLPALKAALWHKDRFVRQRAGMLILKLAPQELPINQGK